MVYEFDGTKHRKLRNMQAARRAKHPDLVRGGTDFTRAAHAVGVSKRTGKVWRNGRTHSTGRNERPLVDRYRGGMDKPKQIDAGHLCMDGRIAIADMRRAGSGVRAIARTPAGRPAPSAANCAATSTKSAARTGRTAPSRWPPTASNAPSHARSCPAHDCGTRSRPDSTSTGAPNRSAAGSDAATRIMEA